MGAPHYIHEAGLYNWKTDTARGVAGLPWEQDGALIFQVSNLFVLTPLVKVVHRRPLRANKLRFVMARCTGFYRGRRDGGFREVLVVIIQCSIPSCRAASGGRDRFADSRTRSEEGQGYRD